MGGGIAALAAVEDDVPAYNDDGPTTNDAMVVAVAVVVSSLPLLRPIPPLTDPGGGGGRGSEGYGGCVPGSAMGYVVNVARSSSPRLGRSFGKCGVCGVRGGRAMILMR